MDLDKEAEYKVSLSKPNYLRRYDKIAIVGWNIARSGDSGEEYHPAAPARTALSRASASKQATGNRQQAT